MRRRREIVIKAVIHRDVSNASSYVAIAVFDDRIEIHSIGGFPTCRAYGIADPTFIEGSGAVTFKAEVVVGSKDLVPGGHQIGHQVGTKSGQAAEFKAAVPHDAAHEALATARKA